MKAERGRAEDPNPFPPPRGHVYMHNTVGGVTLTNIMRETNYFHAFYAAFKIKVFRRSSLSISSNFGHISACSYKKGSYKKENIITDIEKNDYISLYKLGDNTTHSRNVNICKISCHCCKTAIDPPPGRSTLPSPTDIDSEPIIK